MNERPRSVEGVNESRYFVWPTPPVPSAPDRSEAREVLLVDRNGRPLIVREPRPVGFRKP